MRPSAVFGQHAQTHHQGGVTQLRPITTRRCDGTTFSVARRPQRDRIRRVRAAAASATSASWREAIQADEDAAGGPESVGNSGLLAEDGDGTGLTAAELRMKLALAETSGRMDLTDARLTQLPPAVLRLTDLEELSLSGNCLSELPAGISGLTSLKRLGLAGNSLTALPREIGALTSLEGLWLHGNRISALPQELGNLGALKALSLAGNCISEVPAGCMEGMTSLTDLTLAGNRLTAIPPGLEACTALRKLALNGNSIATMHQGLAALSRLTELMLQGNRLQHVDPGIWECQGRRLFAGAAGSRWALHAAARLARGHAAQPSLEELSLGDNDLTELGLTQALDAGRPLAPRLAKLYLYGNKLTDLPVAALAQLPALGALWLEGNPLTPGAVQQLAAAAAEPNMARVKSVGLDQHQVSGLATAALPRVVRVGGVAGSGPGYFKLQYGPTQRSPSGASKGGASSGASSGTSSASASGSSGSSGNDVLVVAFGSAPGTPNWGGLLSKVYKAAEAERGFDVLYVVDGTRDWYGGGGDGRYDYNYYRSRLSLYTQRYQRVLMIGDSMGATAALLFSDLATAVLAFCPQVDLTSASIRPGRPDAWFDTMTGRLIDSVRRSSGEVTALVGTWQHDLDQANMLPPRSGPSPSDGAGSSDGNGAGSTSSSISAAAIYRKAWSWQQQQQEEAQQASASASGAGAQSSAPRSATDEAAAAGNASSSSGAGGATVRVFSVDSHRLAAALDARGQLLPLVRDAILRQMGLRSGNVRLSNVL